MLIQGRRTKMGKKKIMKKIVCPIIFAAAKETVADKCLLALYQPKVPRGLCKKK